MSRGRCFLVLFTGSDVFLVFGSVGQDAAEGNAACPVCLCPAPEAFGIIKLKVVCLPPQKGAGYHLDLFWVAILMIVCSFMGLPWYVAATVISIAHIDSLKMETETSAPGEQPKFLGVRYVPPGSLNYLVCLQNPFAQKILCYLLPISKARSLGEPPCGSSKVYLATSGAVFLC